MGFCRPEYDSGHHDDRLRRKECEERHSAAWRSGGVFNGRDLTNFDTFLKEHGLNNDPDHVFLVENGVIHISGKEFGYVITKKEFANYYLRAEFSGAKVRTLRARGRRGTADLISRAGRAEGLAEIGRVSNH